MPCTISPLLPAILYEDIDTFLQRLRTALLLSTCDRTCSLVLLSIFGLTKSLTLRTTRLGRREAVSVEASGVDHTQLCLVACDNNDGSECHGHATYTAKISESSVSDA